MCETGCQARPTGVRGWPSKVDMRGLRDALRSVSRTPAFAAVVVLTLGLGIGAAVTTFSVMRAVLWKPLPYPDADRLVLLDSEINHAGNAGISEGEIEEL